MEEQAPQPASERRGAARRRAARCRAASNTEVALQVPLERPLSPHEWSSLLRRLFKHLLFSTNQVPAYYADLQKFRQHRLQELQQQRQDGTDGKSRRQQRRSLRLSSAERKAFKFTDKADAVMGCLSARAFPAGREASVMLLFGPTPTRPKEAFAFTFVPAADHNFDGGDDGGDGDGVHSGGDGVHSGGDGGGSSGGSAPEMATTAGGWHDEEDLVEDDDEGHDSAVARAYRRVLRDIIISVRDRPGAHICSGGTKVFLLLRQQPPPPPTATGDISILSGFIHRRQGLRMTPRSASLVSVSLGCSVTSTTTGTATGTTTGTTTGTANTLSSQAMAAMPSSVNSTAIGTANMLSSQALAAMPSGAQLGERTAGWKSERDPTPTWLQCKVVPKGICRRPRREDM